MHPRLALSELQEHPLRQRLNNEFHARPARHDETTNMLGQVAREAAQLLGQPQPFGDAWRFGVETLLGKAGRQLFPLVPPGQRGGQRINAGSVETQRPPGIAQGPLGSVSNQRRGQGRAFAAIFAVDVGDDLVAPLVLEIDVDIRRLAALLGDEALEQHGGASRIDFGDTECETDRGIGRRAAPLAQHADFAGMADDVVDRQEIGFVFQVGNQGQFMFDALPDIVGNALRIAPHQAALGFVAQPGAWRVLGRHNLFRVFVAQFIERKRALLGDTQRFSQQLRWI